MLDWNFRPTSTAFVSWSIVADEASDHRLQGHGPGGGGGGAAVMLSTKEVAVERPPSLTATVIVADPDWPAAGVTVTVRFAPLPPNVMLPFGTSVRFDEPPETVRADGAVSTSPTVNA